MAKTGSVNLADIKKIIQEFLREELARLGIIYPSTPTTSLESKIVEESEDREDDPMDIDMVRLESAKDLLAVEGKVKGMIVQVLLDSCANISFIQRDLANELGLNIDTSKLNRLSGASGGGTTIGMVKEKVSIELAPGCVVEENLAVVDYPHREIGLSRACLKRYNYDIHESRGHVALTYKDKNYFIPIVADQNRGIDHDVE